MTLEEAVRWCAENQAKVSFDRVGSTALVRVAVLARSDRSEVGAALETFVNSGMTALGEPLSFDYAEPTQRVSYVNGFGVRQRATVERYVVTGSGREAVKIGDTWFARHQWIAADVRKESSDDRPCPS